MHRERQVLCCISIPALNPWVKQLLATSADRHSEVKPLQHENKRAYSDESASSDRALCSSISPPGTSVKRICCDKKRVPRNVRCDTELHLPLPESEAKTCLVKVSSFWSVHTSFSSQLKLKTKNVLISQEFCLAVKFVN